MEWMSFVASLVSSLAWPVIVLILVCIIWFSAPQQTRVELLRRVRKIGPGGAELDQAELNTASIEVAEASGALTASANAEPGELNEPRQPDQPSEMDNKTFADTQRLIAAAAKWGWVRAGREASEFPYPIVSWDRHGATIVGTRTVNPGDSIVYAAGSYIDPHTGQPNRSARSVNLGDVDPLRQSDR